MTIFSAQMNKVRQGIPVTVATSTETTRNINILLLLLVAIACVSFCISEIVSCRRRRRRRRHYSLIYKMRFRVMCSTRTGDDSRSTAAACVGRLL